MSNNANERPPCFGDVRVEFLYSSHAAMAAMKITVIGMLKTCF